MKKPGEKEAARLNGAEAATELCSQNTKDKPFGSKPDFVFELDLKGSERVASEADVAPRASTSTLPQKRMATETIDNGRSQKLKDTARNVTPPLPPEVWAQILECCVYDDVARMARVSTALLHETMPLLTSLYIVNDGTFSSEANQASRFQSGRVKDIYIDCTLDIEPDDNRGSPRLLFSYTSSEPTAFIDFVAALPSVRNVFLGAGRRESKAAILKRLQLERDPSTGKCCVSFKLLRGKHMVPREASVKEMHNNVFSALVDNYGSGRLRQQASIYGLPSPDTISVYEQELLHRGMHESFPVEQVWSSVLSHVYYEFSGNRAEFFPFAPFTRRDDPFNVSIQKVLGRGKTVIASTNSRVLLQFLRHFRCRSIVGGDEFGISYMYHEDCIAALRLLVTECGLDPTVFHHDEIIEIYTEIYSKDPYLQKQSLPYKFRESDFRTLVELGFAMGTGSFLVIPDGDFTEKRRLML